MTLVAGPPVPSSEVAFRERSERLLLQRQYGCRHRGAYWRRRSRSVPRSAVKATSEVGTGGLATRVIEADVIPTSPGHGDACGALGGAID